MNIGEGVNLQAKGIGNIFKIIAPNSPNLKRCLPSQVLEAFRTPKRHDQNRTSPRHIIIKTLITLNKERRLISAMEKY
jgi:hypothetical protein